MIIPVYGITSYLAIEHPENELYYSAIRDFYEAYVLYNFIQLLMQYIGGYDALLIHFEFKRRITQPWPLDKVRPLQTNAQFMKRIKQAALQFVIIKPITSVIEIVLNKYDLSQSGNYSLAGGYIWISLVNNISVSLSLYSLVLFYLATHERLEPHRPVIKFLCVKSIIFFSYWQQCLFSMLQMFGVITH